MKKLCVFLAVFLIGAAHAAQTPVTEISGTQASIGALKSQANSKLNVIEANRQDHESRIGTMESGKADQTAVDLKADIADAVQQWDGGYATGYTFNIDDIVAYQGKLWKCLSSHAKASGKYPGNSGNEWAEVSGTGTGSGSTNLSATAGANSVVVASDTGNDATLNGASTIAAGVMTAADKTKLDGIAPGATANQSDAYLLNLANSTGTITASKVSDFASSVNTVLATPLSKLSGIAPGAEVNVNADWNASSGDAQILNKPTIFSVDTDQTITGEKTFEDIILPKFDVVESNVQAGDAGCTTGVYGYYFTATKMRQCINGTASDIGSGGTASVALADITDYPDAVSATELGYLDGVTSAIQTQINTLAVSGVPTVTETPPDATTGQSWYNSTANEFCVAESAGISCVAMTYTADDNDPSNETPWFVDEVDIPLGANKISNAITLAGLGARGAAISVTGSTGAGYSKNSASCTSSAGRGYNDDTVAACVTASSSNNTATTATVTIGPKSDTYSGTTIASSCSSGNERLYPTDVTTEVMDSQGCTSGNHHECIDDTYSSPDDGSTFLYAAYLGSGTTRTEGGIVLGDTSSMGASCGTSTIVVTIRGQARDYTGYLDAQLNIGGSTVNSDGGQQAPTIGSWGNYTFTFTGDWTKSQVDAATLNILAIGNTGGPALWVTAASVLVNYE